MTAAPTTCSDPPASVGVLLGASVLAALPNEVLMESAAETARQMAALAGRFVELLGELDRREGWRDEGATSLEAWVVERCGTSASTARTLAHVAGRLFDLPELAAALATGELSFDKVRAVVDVATPETDHDLRSQAAECSVRQLADLARSTHGADEEAARRDHERRTLRCNDRLRTVSIQLPPAPYAEVRACLEARARRVPSDGETPWDQRLCDAFLQLVRSPGRDAGSSPWLVVAHVPLVSLIDDGSTLAGDLERGGLISAETVRRVACDATVAIAVDDDVGHTMYEGRAETRAVRRPAPGGQAA